MNENLKTMSFNDIINAVRDAIINGNYTVSSYNPSLPDYAYIDANVFDTQVGATVYADGHFNITFTEAVTFDDVNKATVIINEAVDKKIAEHQSEIDALNAKKKAV